MTKLEEGILVKISEKEYELVKVYYKGKLLERENYPESYKLISVPKELGRFMLFRFILENDDE